MAKQSLLLAILLVACMLESNSKIAAATTAYDVLQQNNLPQGLLPLGVKSYVLRSGGSSAPFASLKKQAEILFRLICWERKTLFRLKKQAEKYGL